MASPYSPQVFTCLSNASGLASQLRKVMLHIEKYTEQQVPVPVKLSRKAEQLVERVQSWEAGSLVTDEYDCPMRYKSSHEEKETSPVNSSTSSLSSQTTNFSNSPPKLQKKGSVLSMSSVIRNKYQKTFKKTKNNQRHLISTFKN